MRALSSVFLILGATAALGCAEPEQGGEPGDSATTVAPISIGRSANVDSGQEPSRGGTATVQLFFIALEGATAADKVGCGDGILPMSVDAKATKTPLRFALETLLGWKTTLPGSNAYNALSRMKLGIDSIAMHGDTAIIGLRGHFTYGGVCDAPRIDAQLTRTATQFNTVSAARFFVNGRPLSELLSER